MLKGTKLFLPGGWDEMHKIVVSRSRLDRWSREEGYPEISKLVVETGTFDWKEEAGAIEFKRHHNLLGHKVYDLGGGSDTYVLIAMKPGVIVR